MDMPLAAEHIWNTAHIPVKARGLRVEDCADLNEHLREKAEYFIATFGQRFISPMTPVDHLPKDRSLIGVGMTLSGPAGRGKTSLACAIATEIAIAYHATIFFVAAPNYMTAFFNRHAALVPEAERGYLQTVYNRAQRAALLVLDDLGTEFIANSGSAQKEFTRLLRSRFEIGGPTIITTNLGPGGWTEVYGPATNDFLIQAAPTVPVLGPSLRRGE